MTKGIMDMRSDPPRLVATILEFQHPETKKEVTLYPIPNMAAPDYFSRALDAGNLSAKYDKILWEDGRLPFKDGTPKARQNMMLKRLFPFFSLRPVAADGEKFDGALIRDPFESRMAYQAVLDALDPPVDPRARRGIERIDTYPEGTKVAVPWGVYHMPYLRYRLLKEGFNLTNTEEVVVFGAQQIMTLFFVMVGVSLLMTLVSFALFSSLFR
ncbi:hypothetical protein STCU_04180 [Strigomonas culicis]|nr:hypothetical protein STCU_04180 [Strigomonas culicis]|eukprot:EPY30211.1 hypothetical protein STCU_04180 [Strigomonas culicis]